MKHLHVICCIGLLSTKFNIFLFFQNGSRGSPDPFAMSVIDSVKSLPAEEQFDALVKRFTSLSTEHSAAKVFSFVYLY